MEFVTSISLKTLVIVGYIYLYYVKDAQAQMQMALEATDIELTIVIPDNQLATNAGYISIRHDSGSSQNLTEVLFLVKGDPRIKTIYSQKLTATYTNKLLSLQFKNVAAVDAGTYKCYADASMTSIANCGQLLVIIRKPKPPIVRMLPSSSAVVNSRLELFCETKTTSLPPNHGLESEIWWYDKNGQSVGTPGSDPRVHVGAQSQLVIEPLERADKGRAFACVSADKTGDMSKRITSDMSAPFEVIPEYRPSLQDFSLDPKFHNDEVIEKNTGAVISYTCEAVCWPQCDITWMYKPISKTNDFNELTTLADRKVLTFIVNRTSEGFYQCKAENKHGAFSLGFTLQILYLEAPTVYINEERKTTARVLEDTPVNLKCVFDSNPEPVVNWISPSHVMLHTEQAIGPDIVGGGDISKRLYTSTHTLARLKCEDTGVYKCAGNNGVSSGDGLMELVINCPPSRADIPELELKEEYVWELSQPLSFQFVIRAFPEPNITQIVSSVKGVSRPEEIPKDVEITRTLNHDGKTYLTKFGITIKRNLDYTDANRVYTMTFHTSEFKEDLEFKIHPRGPPNEVDNLTAVDIHHDSLTLFWLPGFNGGEQQTFSVQHRIHDSSKLEPGMELYDDSYRWNTVLDNIAEGLSGNWIEVIVGSLRSSTDYVIRVKAINALGSSVRGIAIKTAVAPASLGPGAICGIVFGVLILLVIIAVILYFFVYKKRFETKGDHTGVNRISILPERIAALFRKEKYNSRQGVSGKPNGSTPKEGPWVRVRKLLQRGSSGSSPEYIYVPPKDYIDPNVDYDNGNNDEAGEYINTALSTGSRYPADDNYGHESALNNNAVGTRTPDSGRKMNDEGLVYVEVDFPGVQNNRKEKDRKAKDKKKKKKNEVVHKSNESVNYSDIDFSQTAAKRKELEEAEKSQEPNKEDEEEALNVDDENASRHNKYADAGYGIGTTV